jgi:hypothetical protein
VGWVAGIALAGAATLALGGIAAVLPNRLRAALALQTAGMVALGVAGMAALTGGQGAGAGFRSDVSPLAHFDGREPCSYLLDPAVNYVPEVPLGGEDSLVRHALCFTGRHPDSGRRFELVTLPDGCAFDLLGISR